MRVGTLSIREGLYIDFLGILLRKGADFPRKSTKFTGEIGETGGLLRVRGNENVK